MPSNKWMFMSQLAGAGLMTSLFCFGCSGSVGSPNSAEASSEASAGSELLRVETIHPEAGGVDRVTVQPGTVHSYDWADLFSKVSGVLGEQKYDIGHTVKKDEEIAVIDAPELEADVKRSQAAVTQAKAKVDQMVASIKSAKAMKEAAEAGVKEAEADVDRAAATLSFNDKKHKRMQALYAKNAVEEQLVEEAEDQFLAAKAGLEVSKAKVLTGKAQVAAAEAKITQATADLGEAQAQVAVASAELTHAELFNKFRTIRSPYDGMVTQRNYHIGSFIRTGDNSAHAPIYTISRTDKMRVIVEIPDRDVRFADEGDKALIEVDALPNMEFEGTISRIAFAENTTSRTERVEIDLENPDGLLKHGMYGRVSITLEAANKDTVRIPSSCLNGESVDGYGKVFVVKNGKAQEQEVELGADNGIVVEVLSGLSASDVVVANSGNGVTNGLAVEAIHLDQSKVDVKSSKHHKQRKIIRINGDSKESRFDGKKNSLDPKISSTEKKDHSKSE